MIKKLERITGDTSSGECVVIDRGALNKLNEIIDVVNSLSKDGCRQEGILHALRRRTAGQVRVGNIGSRRGGIGKKPRNK